MPEIKALKCESCGAPLEAELGQTMLKCPFCGTVNMIKPDPGETETRIELSAVVETTVEEVVKITPPPPPTTTSKIIGGLIAAVILLSIIGPTIAVVVAEIIGKMRGPNYSLLQGEIRGDKMAAVLYGDSKYYLARVNPKTGRLIWRKEIGNGYSLRRISLGEDRFYTLSDDGSLRCYDLDRGDILWEENPGALVYLEKNLIPLGDGLCFLGNDDTLRFFDGNGKQTMRVFQNDWRSFSVYGDKIYLAQDSLIRAFNPKNGKVLFTVRMGHGLRPFGPYVMGNDYYTNKTRIFRIDPQNGSALWQISFPGDYSFDSLLVTGGGLYLLDDSIVSINPTNGQTLGVLHDEAWEPTKIISGDKALYVILRRTKGVTTYRLIAVNPGSLAKKWGEELKDTLIIVGDGVFIVDTASGSIIARKLDPETGKELWMQRHKMRYVAISTLYLVGDNLIIGSRETISLRTRDGKKAWKGIMK
ncbi:MAG: zinc finger domain-containing protein [candidate division WOR-3 bacterium]